MLHQLPKVKYKTKKRVGRGMASGKGKTSTRGHNGQKSRSGKKMYAGFEGGQTRLMMRVPKLKGFNSPNKEMFQIVNIAKLEAFDDGTTITSQELADKGFIKEASKPVKILGNGKLTKKLTIKADRFSKSAIDQIQKAGGSYEVLANSD